MRKNSEGSMDSQVEVKFLNEPEEKQRSDDFRPKQEDL